MRIFYLFLLTIMLALILSTSAPAPIASASAAWPDEVSQRAPFSLELPDVGAAVITAAQARVPTANLRTLRFKVRQPFADSIDPGKIYTFINGEAAATIQGVKSGRDGRIVTCDLESKPRFRLHPGKNVIEISALDHSNHSYYASYVLLVGGQATQNISDATLEFFPVEGSGDREPPEINMTTPNGPVRLMKETAMLRVRGTVADASDAVMSVKVNGQAALLSPARPGAPARPGESATASASRPLAFERTINIGASTSSVIVEAQDRAGNQARLTIPVRRREAAVSSKFSGRKFAVVIGVSRYKFHDGGLNDLQYADADARAVRDFLRQREGGGFAPDDILYLENEQATIEGVRSALRDFLRRAAPEDLILLYIAGHGAPDPYAPQKLYFLLHDTKVADMPGTALPMSELKEFLDGSVRAKRVVVFIDACHSAGLSGAKLVTKRGLEQTENNVFNLYAERLFSDSGKAVLTSSDINEISQESSSWGGGHGIFTWSLLEGLRGEADSNNDHLVTAGELFDFVRDRVRLETTFTQNPRVLPGLNNDLALAVASTK
ncbi:MAG TPA: caspase family protein [Pyrinomonadaceae bacterium]|jgi:hypothetical protein|nr:caspase family protein [Pyrinomonadaceae bacterium]